MNEKIKHLLLKSQILFYASFIILLALGMLSVKGYIPKHNLFAEGKGVYFQTVCLLVFLSCIPLCLHWFHKKIKYIAGLEEVSERIRFYEKAFTIRIALFDVMCCLSIFLILFTNMENAKMFFYMIIVFYLFLIPGKAQILKDLNVNEDGSAIVPEEPIVKDPAAADDDDDDFIPKNH